MKEVACIYMIAHMPTGRYYIGSAYNFKQRITYHITTLKRGRHANYIMQEAWNSDRMTAFYFVVLEPVSDKSAILDREQYWIDRLHAADGINFNICPNARTTAGRPVREKTRQKMRAARAWPKWGNTDTALLG